MMPEERVLPIVNRLGVGVGVGVGVSGRLMVSALPTDRVRNKKVDVAFAQTAKVRADRKGKPRLLRGELHGSEQASGDRPRQRRIVCTIPHAQFTERSRS